MQVAHKTEQGTYYCGDAQRLLRSKLGRSLQGKVQMILTSPPFPLNEKKSYGNLNGEEYKQWFTGLAETFAELLTDDGSIIIEMGNAWVPGRPVQSLLHLESLIGFVNSPKANLRLCQQFVCYNPSRLPSPAPWVTIQRIRCTDSYTHVWWMAKSDFPKADNRKILRPYSSSMNDLLKAQSYNSGRRPSQHNVSQKSFLTNHGGSIMPNFIELEAVDEGKPARLPNVVSIANTCSTDFFHRTCRERKINMHPARMPVGLASLFIQYLTEPGDLVLDPFAGSNTTGFSAELLGRKWVSIEIKKDYSEQSKVRFEDPVLHHEHAGEDRRQWEQR